MSGDKTWITIEGGDGPGRGKHIVFMSGDEEYRSEEGLPMLAQVMARHHGFKCTVLFAIDPQTGLVVPTSRQTFRECTTSGRRIWLSCWCVSASFRMRI